MIGQIKIKYAGPVPGRGLTKTAFKDLIRRAWIAAGTLWHADFRDKHFTKAGASEYGYAPRRGEPGNPGPTHFIRSYTGRKLRMFGHTDPLVWSGESKGLTRMRDLRSTATATSSKLRIVIHANKLNLRHPNQQANMREEMTRVAEREAVACIRTHTRFVEAGLRNAASGTYTIVL